MSHATISGATSGEAWANTQDVYHFSINYGFRDAAGVQIPANLDGTAAADGNPITNPAGPWHNAALTKVNFAPEQEAPWVDRTEYAGYWTLAGSHTPIIANELLAAGSYSGTAMSVFARVRNVELTGAARNLIALDGGSTVTDFIQFYFDVDADLVVFSDTSYVLTVSGYTPALAADWHDFLFVVNGTSLSVYLDGQLYGTATMAVTRAWEDFTRVRILSHPTVGANRFEGDISRLSVYPVAITPGEEDEVQTVVDLRFDWDRLMDEHCRMATQIITGATPAQETIPTAYQFGDAEGVITRDHTEDAFETRYYLTPRSTPQNQAGVITDPQGVPYAFPDGTPIAFD